MTALLCIASFSAGLIVMAIIKHLKTRNLPIRVRSYISEFGPHFVDVPSDCSGYTKIEVDGKEVWRSRTVHHPMKFTEREAWRHIADTVKNCNGNHWHKITAEEEMENEGW